jgi:hypothetical protein
MPSARKPAPSGRHPAPRPSPRVASPVVAGALMILLVLLCYLPMTRYYLAQDDFILLERASHGIGESMSPYFNLNPGQFRPLTKGLYFLLAWPLFGLTALPYHVISILLHALNSILAGVVLRRLGISALVSWVGAVFFAFHLCHIEAIAWASCIQQLMGGAFVFVTLIFGLDAMAGRDRAPVLAAVAYALALASYEQTMAAPLVLAAWVALHHGARDAWRAASGPLRPMFMLLAVYLIYVFGLRGMPESGPYAMGVGANVLENLRAYTGIAFSMWLLYPAYGLPVGFTASHAAWIVVTVLLGALRSFRELAFGVTMFLAFLAPVLFTSEHTHSFHLYVPAIGVCFLLASVLEGVRRLAGVRLQRAVTIALVGAAVVGMGGSMWAVRKNNTAPIDETVNLPRLFVLRRAVLAERMVKDIKAKFDTTAPRLILIYPVAELEPNWRNVQSALGDGSAVRLVLNRPDLDVMFVPPATLPDATRREVMVFTEWGSCHTLDEWKEIKDQIMPAR